MLESSKHLSFERLADFVEEQSPRSTHLEVQAHLANCEACHHQAESLRSVIDLMRTDDAPAVAEHVVNRAVRIFRTERLRPQHGSFDSLRRRVVATLRFDSATSGLVMGQRGSQGAQRELLYETEDTLLEVRIDQSGSGWAVGGQVLGACSGGEVHLENAGNSTSTSLNSLCEFDLPPVQEGIYLLILTLDDVDIEVPGLKLPL